MLSLTQTCNRTQILQRLTAMQGLTFNSPKQTRPSRKMLMPRPKLTHLKARMQTLRLKQKPQPMTLMQKALKRRPVMQTLSQRLIQLRLRLASRLFLATLAQSAAQCLVTTSGAAATWASGTTQASPCTTVAMTLAQKLMRLFRKIQEPKQTQPKSPGKMLELTPPKTPRMLSPKPKQVLAQANARLAGSSLATLRAARPATWLG